MYLYNTFCFISNFSEGIRFSNATLGLIFNNTINNTFFGGNAVRIMNSSDNTNITNKSLRKLTNIICLDISRNDNITDYGLETLTNIISLDISKNRNITDNCLNKLTKLINIIR